jgi:ectoine hydroxylase-related dioxygenase (phytanoyl-CoA dioxygenase family)
MCRVHSPPFDGSYPVTCLQTVSYKRKGHVLLRKVATSEEISAVRGAIEDTVQVLKHEHRSLQTRDTYGKAFLQTVNLWRADNLVKRFVMARRFAQIAADLMGVDRVYLYHDQALFKEGAGGLTPWHQDQTYWPLCGQTITMWMPIVNITKDMGIMQFASGSNRGGPVANVPISDQSERVLGEHVEHRKYHIEGADEMAAGDATYHCGWTLHGAPANRTCRTRKVITIIYFAEGTKISAITDNNYRDHQRYFAGAAPGSLATSPLCPLVFERYPARVSGRCM